MKYILSAIICFLILSACTEPEPQSIPLSITFSEISEVYADTASLKGPVKTVTLYKTNNTSSTTKIIDGEKLYIFSKTTYTSDKKKLNLIKYSYKDSYNDSIRYFYNKDGKLYFIKNKNKEARYFWYDEKGNPTEALKYRISENKKVFDDYERINYTYSEEQTQALRMSIYYDTIKSNYTNSAVFDKYGYPLIWDEINYEYQSFDGKTLPIKIGDNVITRDKSGQMEEEFNASTDKRVQYMYDEEGRLKQKQQSELAGVSSAHTEIFEYDNYGNEKIKISSYQKHVSTIEYEYKYDQYGNWTQKNIYSSDNDTPKKLSEIELREITYYAEGETNTGIDESYLPISDDVRYIADNIEKWADEKKEKSEAYRQAVDDGDFDTEITLTSAEDINDFTPKWWRIIGQADGDLNGDGIADKAIVYNTPVSLDEWEARCLAIYKKEDGKWKLWLQTFAPLLSSGGGGMMGDPFSGISIEDGCIIINHWGGSREKWSYQHSYKYVNDNWHLIHAITSSGDACRGHSMQYDLLTGDILTEDYIYDCEEDGTKEENKKKELNRIPDKLPLITDPFFNQDFDIDESE
ncbi:hypothetical protein M2451_000626 [Dysgonomonas sp. PFB1-18]|uniref:hypothetical protein n=1 Tax=unclassified Dysgonomonas TaxID=2630389 RepID=UPI002475C445|nr:MULTISPECIES: hypothetical protein [unclassified Dysgonomonas]MDH6307477.1 hypothetical protein [Dysgonomonas sp. PF1-14]MDH6337395.1 hypothetical protein [Dysgonomonas sp. PF1-16]MDH6379319.1 hypothetical protein [Dysgonomonas sp. PFB1-18]MDH6396043.1 hypothetical protein [Dysgonomonas sp. PF1-23]